jgi:hypothetical protein
MEEDLFGGSRVGRRFWLLGLAQAAHSMEEMRARLYDFMWIATERLGLPRMGMSATTFALVNMGIIAFFLGIAPFVAARRDWAIAVAWIVALVEIANGAGHLTAVVLFRSYAPGAITAPLLIAAGIALIPALRRESSPP